MFEFLKPKREPILPLEMKIRVRQTTSSITLPQPDSQVEKFNSRYSDPFREKKEHVSLSSCRRSTEHKLNKTKKKGKTLHSLTELEDPFTS